MLEDSQRPQASGQSKHAAVGVRVKTEVYKKQTGETISVSLFLLGN